MEYLVMFGDRVKKNPLKRHLQNYKCMGRRDRVEPDEAIASAHDYPDQ
ncbi:hypothetical protein [Spirulina sp. 06S082]|nr:hypothetical protein [Spirulina sp. 06S082]MEA5469329.1 hypothetical protein [Spirulina sp. 06S082]